MQAEKATEADFEAVEQDVELPELQRGRRVTVRVRAVDAEAVVAAIGGIPSLTAGGNGKAPETDGLREFAPMRQIAEAGIVSPQFSFGKKPENGKAWWGMVRPANRVAIVNAIMEASGLDVAGGGPLATFPDGGQGRGPGAGAGRDEQAPAEPEPGLAPAS